MWGGGFIDTSKPTYIIIISPSVVTVSVVGAAIVKRIIISYMARESSTNLEW